jgi:hypothetical protein
VITIILVCYYTMLARDSCYLAIFDCLHGFLDAIGYDGPLKETLPSSQDDSPSFLRHRPAVLSTLF